MYHMARRNSDRKWRSCIILSTTLSEIEKFCKIEKNSFANPTQFINFTIRKELDRRKTKR